MLRHARMTASFGATLSGRQSLENLARARVVYPEPAKGRRPCYPGAMPLL